MAGAQVAEQVVERRADVGHVDLDVRERRRAERDDDVLGAARRRRRGRRPSSVPAAWTRSRTSWAPGSSNGMRASRTACRRSASLSTPRTRQAAVGEREGEREADPAEPDDGDVGDMRSGIYRSAGVAKHAVAHVLPREARDEARVVARVAPPQAARLLRQAEHPLQAGGLHPRRRLRDEAGVEVERGADADEHGRVEAVAHRAPSTSPAWARRCRPRRRPRCERFISATIASSSSLGEVAEGRRVAADDLHAGEAVAQVQRELDERALVAAAVEVHARAGRAPRARSSAPSARGRRRARSRSSPSAFIAHTSGWPSGTVSRGVRARPRAARDPPRRPSRVRRGDADVALLAWAIVASIQSIVSS